MALARVLLMSFIAVLTSVSTLAALELKFDLTMPPQTHEDEKAQMLGKLRAASQLNQLSQKPHDKLDALQIVAAAKGDYTALIGAMQSIGYFGASVSITLDGNEAIAVYGIDQDRAPTTALIKVQSGAVFTFGDVNVAPLPEGAGLPARMEKGEVALPSVIESAVQDMLDAWRDAGHMRAQLGQPRYIADHKTQQLHVKIPIIEGPAFTVGPLQTSSPTSVQLSALRAMAGLPLGAPLTPQVLSDAQTRLVRSGAFGFVALSPAAGAGPKLQVHANLKDEKPRRIGFGAGFATSDGVTLDGFFLHRNLLGGAERLRLWATAAGIGESSNDIDLQLGARIAKPAVFLPDITAYGQSSIARTQDPLAQIDEVALELGLQFHPIDPRALQFGGAIKLARSTRKDAIVNRAEWLLSAPISVKRDLRNPARGGVSAALTLAPFVQSARHGAGLSAAFDLRGEWVIGQRVNLAAQTQLNSIIGPDMAQTPSQYLVFSGGANTVRGHDYNSLGVHNAGGDTGGQSRLASRVELRFTSKGAWGGHLFYDWARLGAGQFPQAGDPSHSGAGIGISYKTGFAPLRLDVATAVSGPKTGGVKLYFGIGQAF